MACIKYWDDETKVRLLKRTMIGTKSGLSALQHTPTQLSYQRLINTPWTSLWEMDPFKLKRSKTRKASKNRVRIMLQKTTQTKKEKPKSSSKAVLTDFIDAFYTKEKHWRRPVKSLKSSRASLTGSKSSQGKDSVLIAIVRNAPCECALNGQICARLATI